MLPHRLIEKQKWELVSGIYSAYNSQSIIVYPKSLVGDMFTKRFTYYHFDEQFLPRLGRDETHVMKNN